MAQCDGILWLNLKEAPGNELQDKIIINRKLKEIGRTSALKSCLHFKLNIANKLLSPHRLSAFTLHIA